MLGSEVTKVVDDPGGEKSCSVKVSSVSCSICLDLVTDNGDRSRAKLQCGHEFHLDCIGSAFNVKGAMQCPNCRKVESGRWLYATGPMRAFPEFNIQDWTADEDPYELSYMEMPFGVHWCPFSGLTRVHSSFEDVESPSTAYHDLQRYHAIFAEHAPASSVPHSYVAYFGPLPPASSNTNEIAEDPNVNHTWNGQSERNEIFTPHAFPMVDIQYQSWDHLSPLSTNSNHINTDQAAVHPPTGRSTRGEYDGVSRSTAFPHPFLYGYGSAPGGGSSFFSSFVHPGVNGRTHERVQVSHAIHYQQPPSNSGMPAPMVPGLRRLNNQRGFPLVMAAASQSDRNRGFFVFPSPGSSVGHPHETENPSWNHIHARERDHISRLPVISFERDPSRESFQHASGGFISGNWSGGFWQRHWS